MPVDADPISAMAFITVGLTGLRSSRQDPPRAVEKILSRSTSPRLGPDSGMHNRDLDCGGPTRWISSGLKLDVLDVARVGARVSPAIANFSLCRAGSARTSRVAVFL